MPIAARAHEGESHGETAAAPVVAGRHTLVASSERHELVVKNDPLSPRIEGTLHVYLSDFVTNAPTAGATIAFRLRTPGGGTEVWSGTATPTDAAGVYRAAIRVARAGVYDLFASVSGSGSPEEFLLSGLEIGTAAAARGSATGGSGSRVALFVAIAGVLVVLAAAWRRRRGLACIPALLLATLVPPLVAPHAARAHEGHDAPVASGAPVIPGATVYLAKESQFLLGVLTRPVRKEWVQGVHTVLGRVAPRGGGEVEIAAPQQGRIYFPGGVPPVIGDRVRRGQPLARLVVVDGLPLRSPISGAVTGVFAVHGQLVQAGQKLLTLLDPSVVWVHADVFETDLPSVANATHARITTQAWPDLVLRGRKVALGATQGEVPGAVEAWFEVPNPGGHLTIGSLVDVGIERGAADSALVLPRAAIAEKDGRTIVFVHTAPERFTAREVVVTEKLGESVAVRGDLAVGDRVVVAGGYPLLSAPVLAGAR